jgi:hypothetical protein
MIGFRTIARRKTSANRGITGCGDRTISHKMDQQKSLGSCRVILPPRDYSLGVAGRANGRLRAEPQPLTIRSNQSVRVAMDIDRGGLLGSGSSIG